MSVIKLQLPSEAANLICSQTIGGTYEKMVENSGLTLMEMMTFGMVITPIVETETGAEHHHVTYWQNGMVSVTEYTPGEDFMPLVGLEYWGKSSPNCDECLDIFFRHVPEALG